MSKISLKTYILALGLLISLSSRQSYAQFCHADIDGQIQINTELLELPADLQNDYAKLAGKLKALGQYVARLKERTLVLTPTKGEEKLLSATSYKNELMAVQTEVLNLLNQIPTTHRMAGQVLIEAYFQIADRLMFLEILQAPAQANMSALKSRYSLPVPQEAFENIYPLGLNLPAGLDAQIQTGANSSHVYSLTFSGENVFRALVRGAAQSPITRQNKSAYLDTVRCGLNKILIGKIKINQALLGRANEKLSIHEDTNVCLQTSATEFENLSKDDIEIRKEKLLRGVIAEELPQLFSGLSSSAVQIFNSTRLGELIGQLRLFPDWLSELNANRTESEPEVTPSELTQIVNEINLGIENEYSRVPALNIFRKIWAEPEMAALFEQILNNCQYNLKDAYGKEINKEDLVQKLTAAEDFYFFTNLSYDLELLSVRLTKMSASEIESTLKNFIISRKFTSINQALVPVINYFTTSQNPDLDQLLAAIQKDLKPIAYKIINNRINKSNLNSYIQTLTSKALQKSASANSLQLLLETFTAEMIEAAKKIKSYLDESTLATSLPLDQKALVRALKSSISAISTPVQSRIYILVNEPDFAIQKQIWSGIESSLNANIKRFGVKCEPIGFTAQISNWSRGLFQNEKTKLEREAAQRDCDLANVVGSALGLKRENQFGEFADVHATLAQKMSADDLNVFVKNYREELTFDLFTEFQMLNADINKKQKLYDVLAESKSVESSLPLVKENIEKSIAPLNATLKTVSASRSVKDLDFIIKRTKIINALLGENDLSTLSTSLNGYNALGSNISDIMESRGFVFPNLIEYHKKIQTEMINNEEINDQVYEEFLTANIYISMGVIGGWAAQHFLGVLPRWMGGPSIAGLIHNVGSKTINLIDGHGWFLMGLIGGHIGTLELKKNDFKTGLKHINDLTQSETLKPEGAENPLPLIEWSDYQQQLRYYTEGIHAANMNQLMDLGWLTFPFMMNRAIQHGTKRMTDGLGRKNEKFQVQSFKQRGFYEIRTRMSLNHKMKLMRSSFKDIKNPRSLDLTELQIGRDLALREARTAAEKIRINQSYDKIILEFGSRLERVIDHPAILESYSRAMFGNSGTISQAHRFYEEFRAIALKARQII